MTHPYSCSRHYQLHKSAIKFSNRFQFNPALQGKFVFERSDSISTMGSCFAQEVSIWLLKKKHNFLRINSDLKSLADTKNRSPKAQFFSGDYGNVYTTRQALQLLKAAIGEFNYCSDPWIDSEGLVVDPIRPAVASGLSNLDDMLASRAAMLSDLRKILTRANVFIFTLGLTECWIRNKDGAALPTAPGVVAGDFSESDYHFKNESYEEVITNLRHILAILKAYNGRIKVVLTVSPIPLAATAVDRHIAVSSMASKAILRTSAEVMWQETDVDYFPSFEMFYTPGMCDAVFADDFRHASRFGVERVMRAFQSTYLQFSDQLIKSELPETSKRTFSRDVNTIAGRVICDEDQLS